MTIRSLRGLKGPVPAGAVRIDRRTPWGNPFPMKTESERAEVIEKYRVHLWEKINQGEIPLEDLAQLHGCDLYCWCSPKPCHGDVLAVAAAWAHTQLVGRRSVQNPGNEGR